MATYGSPVSDDGRGLKPADARIKRSQSAGSPVSDDGRGLKQVVTTAQADAYAVRPSVMTGAD